MLALIHPGHGPERETIAHWLLAPSHLGGVLVLIVALALVVYSWRRNHADT